MKEFAGRLNELYNFVNKQNITGKIFDFEVEEHTEKIIITKYYDLPGRDVVIIPDFVDKLGTSNDISVFDEKIQSGIFSYCKYIKKVVMHSNIKGSLQYLFQQSIISELDLSDFDTINITDMTGMFEQCSAKVINFGDKFNTENVENMESMFSSSKVKNIVLDKNFNTKNVESMGGMFMFCRADEIQLGDKFDTSKVKYMEGMFAYCKVGNINLGDKFNTENVKDMTEMFYNFNSEALNLGDKFDTTKASLSTIFGDAKIKELNLGNKFSIHNDKNIKNMFIGLKADTLYFTNKIDFTYETFEYTENFRTVQIKNDQGSHIRNAQSIHDIFINSKIKNVIMPKETDENLMGDIRAATKANVVSL